MGTEKILIIGSGGREHAIVHALHRSPGVHEIFVAPGNAGTQELAKNIDIAAEDISRLESFARDTQIDLTVVGPEGPLATGIVDAFQEAHLNIFGPTQKAARLETDKVFSSQFVEQHAIPHPDYFVPRSFEEALDYVQNVDPKKFVIKAKGLAFGKGVILPDTTQEAIDAVVAMMQQKVFGEAGNEIVFQERLYGREVSVFTISDGVQGSSAFVAQDHKGIFDGNLGPRTGGMGAYTPVPFMSPEMLKSIHQTILQPTIDGMREEGSPFRGLLYAGLMLTEDGPKVLEYNCRFGDPETQPIMMLLESDLSDLLLSSAVGSLEHQHIRFRDGFAVCVVLASDGYPGSYTKGYDIHLSWPRDPDVAIFHAGTMVKDGKLVTNGGRVLGVTAYGLTLAKAIECAYKYIEDGKVGFDGMQYRTDIGKEK